MNIAWLIRSISRSILLNTSKHGKQRLKDSSNPYNDGEDQQNYAESSSFYVTIVLPDGQHTLRAKNGETLAEVMERNLIPPLIKAVSSPSEWKMVNAWFVSSFSSARVYVDNIFYDNLLGPGHPNFDEFNDPIQLNDEGQQVRNLILTKEFDGLCIVCDYS
ncbi:hypothetical protein Ddc_01510 [Ditylenchus destructor]|nr:hypothetical protein Ddc_01510 [Ditylenchus destructor]